MPSGRLVIGAAESLWHLSDRFVVEALPQAVAYRPRAHAPAARAAQPAAPARSAPRSPRRDAPRTAHLDTGPRTTPSTSVPDAQALAREGEAAAARGDHAAAAAAFRGAAYLDPDDAIALTGLGLVLESVGDPGAERAFRSARAALQRRPVPAGASLGGFDAATLAELLAGKIP